MTGSRKDILQGWKDIAAYIARDVRTAKRWETQRGLPVRRTPGEGRANVYAIIPEIDAWLAGTPAEIDSPAPDTLPEAAPQDPTQISATTPPASVADATPSASSFRWRFATAAVLAASAVAIFSLGRDAHSRAPQRPAARSAAQPVSPSRVPAAEALYLRGVYLYEQRTPDALNDALKDLQQAIDLDPGYAPAYSGLSQAYNLVRQYGTMPQAEAYSRGEAAARKAISLDPSLAEAHASLGFINYFWHSSPRVAEQEFRRALELDPGSALVHHWYGSMLTHQGRFTESLAHLDEAQRLQPTSISILSDRALSLGLGGHRKEAVELLQEVLRQDPKSSAPHYILADLSLLQPRDIPSYIREMHSTAALRHDPAQLALIDHLQSAYNQGGEQALWQANLQAELREHPGKDDATYNRAQTYAALEDQQAALHDLEVIASKRGHELSGLGASPFFIPMHQDPRYLALLALVRGESPQRVFLVSARVNSPKP